MFLMVREFYSQNDKLWKSLPGEFWKCLYIIVLQKTIRVCIMNSAKANEYGIMIKIYN